MKQWLKRISGIEEKERALEEAELELLKKKDPKAYATRHEEPWVGVIDVKVNKDNMRNGFFELDWNEYFIKDLIRNEYGTTTDPEEEIVDRWFRDIVYQILNESGIDTNRGFGYINVSPLTGGKSEVY